MLWDAASAMGSDAELKQRLRSLPVFAGQQPRFDPDAAPDDPAELFVAWLNQALDCGLREPHAMTLSTVDSGGCPNARVLILRGVDEGRWQFATNRESRKGQELAEVSAAAATFYWSELARQVRLRGVVLGGDADDGARDFQQRSDGSKVASLVGRQSEVLDDPAELDAAFADARRKLLAEPALVPEEWTLYHLVPDEVEFWQGDPERRHIRLRYEHVAERWVRRRLWP